MQYNTMQCNAIQYNTIQYNTIQYTRFSFDPYHQPCLDPSPTLHLVLHSKSTSEGEDTCNSESCINFATQVECKSENVEVAVKSKVSLVSSSSSLSIYTIPSILTLLLVLRLHLICMMILDFKMDHVKTM